MAITFAQDYSRNSAGIEWEIYGKMSLDNSYPTGGYLVDPTKFGLSQVTSFTINGETDGYLFEYDKATAKLKVYAGSGGGTFTGTPATLTGTNTAPAFTGDALAGHSHGIVKVDQSDVFSAWRIYFESLVGGPFVVGETVTGGGGSARVSAVTTFGTNGYLDFDLTTLPIDYAVAITGGTSGATAVSSSVYLGLVTPSTTPYALYAASTSRSAGTCLHALTSIPYNIRIINLYAATYHSASNRLELSIDNDGVQFDNIYNISYLTQSTSSNSGGTPSGTNTEPALTMNLYTPAGTISGGGSGSEIPNGTNLSAVTNIEFRVIGL